MGERLARWALRDPTVATVSPLPGTIGPQISERTRTQEQDLLAGAPAMLTEASGAPRVDLAGGAVLYVARAAFELLGGLDESMQTGAGAVAAFGLLARERGLANLLAGDVIVAPGPAGGAEPSDGDRAALALRFPALWAATLEPPPAAVERSRALARAAITRPTVTIDARTLSGGVGGTQTYVHELIRALAESEQIEIRALVGPDAEASAQMEAIEGVSTHHLSAGAGGTPVDRSRASPSADLHGR